jgi:Uma2 family endonuclease
MGIADPPAVLQRYRLTVDQYHLMGDAGVFAPDARVELIEGEVVEMAPMKSRHAGVVGRLTAALQRAVGDKALVWCQLPLVLESGAEPDSEPEPDLMLLRPRADFYVGAHPAPRDVLLLIEVADSSLQYDLGIKVPLYARHQVTEVWVVDLVNEQVRLHRSPQGGDYTDVTSTGTPGAAPVAALPGVGIDLSGIFS